MDSTKKIIRIDGKDIIASEMDIPLVNLLYYPDNPRIKSIIEAEFGDNPSQEQIESKMKSLDHVKELRRSIIANDGLLEPIIVKDDVVLEGNSRLAAYRILCGENPIKWGNIRATVLPPEVSEEQIFSMLGTLHIIGKTPWSPFEQAGYLKRRITTSRKPIDAIADELGLKRSSAKAYIATYDLMVDNDDMESTKWSYYHELYKSSSIRKADENYPQYGIFEKLIEKIKNDDYDDAKQLRSVGKIMGAQGELAQEVIKEYLDGDISLEDGVELVESDSKLSNIISKIRTVTSSLVKEQKTIRESINDYELKFNLINLRQQINNLLGSD